MKVGIKGKTMRQTNLILTIMLLAMFFLVGCSQGAEPTRQSSADEISPTATETMPSEVADPSPVPQETESAQTSSQTIE